MNNQQRSFICGFFLALFSVGLLVGVPVFLGDVPNVSAQALAQDEFFGGEGKTGTSFAAQIGLSAEPSIQVMIARLIRTVISFVGIIAVVMILYAGFLYMTAGGNETRVKTAKKILSQAIIGLVIVLTSFTIVHFIIGRLIVATGGGVGSAQDGGGVGSYPDGSAFAPFHLSSVNTQCAEALRNLQLQFVFSKPVSGQSVDNALFVKETGGGAVEGTFATTGALVTFTPSAACPAPNDSAKCFEAGKSFDVGMNAGELKSTGGASLTCTVEFPCAFSFTTGSGVDISPPKLTMTAPTNGQSVIVGAIQYLQAQTKDDIGVSGVDFFVTDSAEPLFTSGLNFSTEKSVLGNNQENYFTTDPKLEWNTAGLLTNKSYPIWATATDCAGNTATSPKISAVVRVGSCFNTVQDGDLGETGPDCGGAPQSEFYCGACNGDAATDGSACASGVVEKGKCVSKPRIDSVSPGDGAVGNLVTISGTGFGSMPGIVTFFDKDKKQGLVVQPYQCKAETKWSNTQIVVQVPTGALDGPLEVGTAAPGVKIDQTDDAYGPLIADFDVNAIKRPGLCGVEPLTAKPGSPVKVIGLGFGGAPGTSTFFFNSFFSPSFPPPWADTEFTAVVPNMSAQKVNTQVFTGDYRCIDVAGKETGKLCAQDKDCGAGNTCAKSWCSETLAFCASSVACGETGGYCGSVRVGSNTLAFTVEDTTPDATLPVISYVDTGWKACEGGENNAKHCAKKADCGEGECKPAANWGPVGNYVTIYGSGFGSAKGTVHFKSGLEKNALGDTEFPDQCGDDFWSDTSVTVKVPNTYSPSGNVTAGLHQLSLKKGTVPSNSVEFVVVDGAPGPSICKIDPVAGPAKTPVTIFGEDLSSQKGTVTFFQNQSASDFFWETTKVTDAIVPDQAKTGPVYVATVDGYTSNSKSFAVGSCQEDLVCPTNMFCCGDGSCEDNQADCDKKPLESHFAYKVSTGIIPETPTIIAKCDATTQSPTPWENWPDSKTVCLKAVVSATFSMPMNKASLADQITVEACANFNADGECTTWNKLTGALETSEQSFNWDGDGDFAPDTRHRVTVLGGSGGVQAAQSAGGAFMAEDYSWQFTTAAANTFCEIGAVSVTPADFTATEVNQSVSYLANLLAKGYACVKMSCEGQTIAWSSNFSGATLGTSPSSSCAQSVKATLETQGSPAKIKAVVTSANPSPTATGDLIIDFSDPTVGAFFPNCSTACVNAKPWIRFKADMNEESLRNGISMYACENALCAKDHLKDAELIQTIPYDAETDTAFINFKSDKVLSKDTWYRIVLKGSIIQSTSKVFLKDAGSNFGTEQNPYFPGDFSWKFKTKDSDLFCVIDSLSVSPKTKTLEAVGDRQLYSATVYNAPDECDVSGQALQDVALTWGAWKAEDTPNTSADSSTDVAFLLDNLAFCDGAIIQAGACSAPKVQTPITGGFAVAEVSPDVYKEVPPKKVPPTGGYAISHITATIKGVTGITADVTGMAELKVDCSCETDSACGSPGVPYGCGAGSCCFERPVVGPFQPVGTGLCRNTAVSVTFDQKMDADSFAGNLRLELMKNGVSVTIEADCPKPYVFAQAATVQKNVLARLWQWIKQTVRAFSGEDASAAGKKCTAPVTYKTEIDTDGGQLVSLVFNKPLEANSTYRIYVVGDDNTLDGVANGVLSQTGVGLSADSNGTFTTGNEICLLEAVSVEDVANPDAEEYESHSPQFFSKLNEVHEFVAHAQTYREGLGTYEDISPTDVYKWEWGWGSKIADGNTENIVSLSPLTPIPVVDTATFKALGNNGNEHVVATATIIKDTFNTPAPGTIGKQVAGTLEVTAFTCENPWPDSVDGFKPYLQDSDPPSNFGFYYCQDRGLDGTTDDLPSLETPIDVQSPLSPTNGLIQEWLFKVENTPDAIGVRVYQNTGYLSAKAWFEAQNFKGGSTGIKLDGYEGVQSGNTAYVAAANKSGDSLYPNIYVISYNPNAGADAKEIFAQIMNNWRFNANTDDVSNVGLCKIDDAYVPNSVGGFIECEWDGQCVEVRVDGVCAVSKDQKISTDTSPCPLDKTKSAFCDNQKAKIQKDMKRLTDITTQVATLSSAYAKNKQYPTLQEGTFVPAMSVSKWPSWAAGLGNELGVAMPTDPVNEFWLGCTDKGATYDPATCFNGSKGEFVCEQRSHVYGYQSFGGEAYKLSAQLEYNGVPWSFPIPQFPTNAVKIFVEYADTAPDPNLHTHVGQFAAHTHTLPAGFVATPQFCANTVFGVSKVCGDGVVGQWNPITQEGEFCELGEKSTAMCTVTVGTPPKTVNGKINTICLPTCAGFQDKDQAIAAGGVCVPNACGNGVLETGENCDDGVLNGTYGHCGALCTFAGAFLCGDGYLAGGEQCDCGTTANFSALLADADSWVKADTCATSNGQYNLDSTKTCTYDCKKPGPSCGDKIINNNEECDGGIEIQACTSGSPSQVCIKGVDAGKSCPTVSNCPGGACSVETYPLTKTRVCTNTCVWPDWSVPQCLGGDQQCVNGKKEGSEQCDDGNQSNNDSCTNACKTNFCGDTFLFTGVESCDNGTALNVPPGNSTPCSAPYGSDCQYCNTQCQYKTYSGSYCGDGVINGNEVCDKNDFKLGVNGACNGGANNGKPCSDSTVFADCGERVFVVAGATVVEDVECVLPACASDCSAACPSSFKTGSLLVQSELPGAQPLTSIELYSFQNQDGLNQENISPDQAELHIPACTVGTKITANVNDSNVVNPNVDIVFVTDTSISMHKTIGGTDPGVGESSKLEIISDATSEAIEKLFSAYSTEENKDKMRIGLIHHGTLNDGTSDAVIDTELLPATYKLSLKEMAEAYSTEGNSWSNPQGLIKAIKMLKDAQDVDEVNDRIQIVILLSDGAFPLDMDGTRCDEIASTSIVTEAPASMSFETYSYCIAQFRYTIMKAKTPTPNLYFYSAVISTDATEQAYMEHLSSMKCKGLMMSKLDDCDESSSDQEGVYAFNASTKQGIDNMYSAIVQSILDATTTIDSKPGQTPSGNNITLPFPDDFACQDTPRKLPLKTNFYGTGTLKFSDIKFEYCPVE